jgi:hypothetical protein
MIGESFLYGVNNLEILSSGEEIMGLYSEVRSPSGLILVDYCAFKAKPKQTSLFYTTSLSNLHILPYIPPRESLQHFIVST